MPLINNNGTEIYWQEEGSGEPLLLIMGLGYPIDMWFRLAPRLATHYRVIMFDNRGVGRSGASVQPVTMGLMAQDAAAVLDAAQVERAHVLGYSMGGMIAQEFVLTYPQRVKSLILAATGCGGQESVQAAKPVRDILMGRANMTPEEAVWAMVPYIYDQATPPERIKEDVTLRLRCYPSQASYLAQLNAIVTWSAHSRLNQIKAPTLVVHGESDQLVPTENARILARAIAHSELVILPQASHIFTTDQPAQAEQVILNFLRPQLRL